MQKYALIVAGGSGKRMGTDIPKQFLDLGGKPMLMHVIERFNNYDNKIKIIVVLPGNHITYWTDLQKVHSFTITHSVVKGGPHRFFSVKNGIAAIKEDCLIAIHDGVRPLVTSAVIARCFEVAGKYGNAVPVINPSDSMRVVKGEKNMPVSRDLFRMVQTPQVFNSNLIREAYNQEYSPDFTDDATVLEQTGHEIHLVEGNRENIKITNPEDLIVASALLPIIS